jgi:hypothetical protein
VRLAIWLTINKQGGHKRGKERVVRKILNGALIYIGTYDGTTNLIVHIRSQLHLYYSTGIYSRMSLIIPGPMVGELGRPKPKLVMLKMMCGDAP